LAHRLAAVFRRRLSNLFLLAGLSLLLVGAVVQASRRAHLSTAARPRVAAAALPARLPLPRLTVQPTRDLPAAAPERLVVPVIGLDTPVVPVGWEARVVNGDAAGNVWQTADNAAGFHQGSALPGRVGNTVISGHNNMAGAVFRRLHLLRPFDWIFLVAGGRRFAYLVDEAFIVPEAGASAERRRENVRWISPSPEERLTLVSCFPPWGNSHRTIVLARPVPDGVALPPDAPAP
jgi:sortase A